MSRAAKKIILCFLFCFAVWLAGLTWFIAQIPTFPATSIADADAIIVLTGGIGRLEYGLKLLDQHKAPKLFISGVGKNLTLDDLLHADTVTSFTDRHAITLGHQAENTIGNAEETTRWLKKQNSKTILLVTSNYHMPRSMQEFSQINPSITIIAAPVFPNNFILSDWWRDPTTRTLLLSEYHKYIASALRHWLISITHR